ncbi:MAG: choice-of-anchor D domain-containing protein [Candidatus Sulfotelmatobacter sp.]
MQRRTIVRVVLSLTAAVCASQVSPAQEYLTPVAMKAAAAQTPRPYQTYGVPLTFEMNQGQSDPRVKFLSRGSGYKVFLTAGGMVLSLRPSQAFAVDSTGTAAASNQSHPAGNTTLQFKLVGAAQNPTIVGESPLPGRVNYFIGRDPAKWRTNVRTYARVRYKNVYPGIDLVYYGSHQQLEYDFAVAPGADPNQIQFAITGSNQIRLDAEGNLVLQTSSGELHFQSPVVYQESGGVRTPVSGSYMMNDATHIAFHIAQYDAGKPLVIDPVLVYSTYVGGSGDDQASGIAVDSTGSVYLAGYTDSPNFPLSTLGSPASGSTHVFVAKLDSTGSNLIYADYIGGNNDDYGYALVLDGANEVYVTGSTASSDFPAVNAYQGTYPGSFNGFLTKLSADGSSLLYSTYLGGNGSDQPASIAIDNSGSVLVAGNTSSTNFPVANAYQAAASSNQGGVYGNYGFLTKFSPDGSYLVYSTYLAGNTNVAYNCGGTPCWSSPYSAITGIALDSSGNAYAAGITNTYNFPTTLGTYLTTDSTPQNNIVGFVSQFSSAGALNYSTYFYESSGILTNIDAIAVDGSSSAYIAGSAFSDGTFPVTSTSICDPGTSGYACDYAFVTKFDPTGATLSYSTFLGVNNNANPQAIVLDTNNDAYVLASTSSSSFGIVNGIESYSNGNDLLLVEIDPVASSELFATYLGGSADEYPAAIAIDSAGSLYVAGSTDSSDLPVTQGAFQNVLGGGTDAFVMKISPSSAPAVALSPYSLQYSSQAVASTSAAQTALLRNMGSSALAISSITASGDFAELDNCGTSVLAASSCTLSVTFTPTAVGTRLGSISIQDNAAGPPHVISLSGIGSGPVAALSPGSLSFSPQLVGSSSAAQPVALTNTGNATMNLGTIQVTGDFSQVNNCTATLAANASCTINVTFTPTASGTRSGALSVSDDAQGTPQTVNLTGTGSSAATPIAVVSPASLSFSSQPLTTSSASQAVTLSNPGSAGLNIGAIQVTGDFAQTNNCPATLAANSRCTVNVTFTPTASGARSGTLTVTDNASGSPQVVNLAGTGTDFSLTNSTGADTIQPGSAANYTLTVSHLGGSFGNAVKLTCSGLPAQTSCSLSPTAVTPGASSASSTLTITSTATVSQAVPRSSRSAPIYAVWIQLQTIGLFGFVVIASRRSGRKLRGGILSLLLTASLLFMTGCAGGTGIGPTLHTGTSAGTYTITVTGSSGNLQHSLPVTLVVQ